MLEVGLRVPACLPATEVAAFIERAESAGFAAVAVPDIQLIARDPFVTLALAAARTRRIVLYVAVANGVTRHASVLASSARTVEELAPGRFRIVVGRGDSAVKTVGLAPSSLAGLRGTVDTMKGLLAAETADVAGIGARLAFASPPALPVYVAATGPKGLELAGEIGDGVLVQVPNLPTTRAAAWQRVVAGAARRGRNPAALDVIWGVVPAVVGATPEEARMRAHAYCASWVLMPDRANWLRAAGIDVPSFEVPAELAAVYPDIAHAEDPSEVRRLTPFLTDELVDRICDTMGLFGTPEACARVLAHLAGEGVGKVFVRSPETYRLPEDLLAAFETGVFPHLRALLS